MAITRVTASEFADQISTNVNTRNRTLDTRVGPIRDLFVDPFSYVLENQNDRIVYLNDLTSLKNAPNLVPDDLDDIVYNENMVRWAGSRAITTVIFARINPPTSDIVIPVNFPIATKVNPQTGVSILFRTIESQTMYASSPPSASRYYNNTSKRFEIEVAVASIMQGTTASIGQYTITEMRRPLSGIDEVYNVASTTAGRPLETNQELADRYLLHVEGSQVGTPAGIKRFLLDNISSVTDSFIVYGSSAYLTREDSDAGAVDVWFMGDAPATRSYLTTYPGTYILQSVDFQPIMSVTSVSSVAGAATYTEGTDYEVVKGLTEYSYSNRGNDGIRWLPGGSHPAIGQDVTIAYTYNSLNNVISSFFTQEEYYSMGTDLLFRWAQQTSIEIEATLKVRSGTPTTVTNVVRDAVLAYINSLKLGQNVEEFDIDSVVSKIFGVDNWTYTKLCIKGGTGVGDITIEPSSYARLLASDFVINVA